jgi:hypothetical protein
MKLSILELPPESLAKMQDLVDNPPTPSPFLREAYQCYKEYCSKVSTPKQFLKGQNELSPEEVISVFKRSQPTDWIHEEGTYGTYGNCENLLVSLRSVSAEKFELRYGYQTVATVSRIDGSVEPLDLEVINL